MKCICIRPYLHKEASFKLNYLLQSRFLRPNISVIMMVGELLKWKQSPWGNSPSSSSLNYLLKRKVHVKLLSSLELFFSYILSFMPKIAIHTIMPWHLENLNECVQGPIVNAIRIRPQ